MSNITLKQITLTWVHNPSYEITHYDDQGNPWYVENNEGNEGLSTELAILAADFPHFISKPTYNGYVFATLLPSGSKDGWDASTKWEHVAEQWRLIANNNNIRYKEVIL
jgi:hypothetical protein